MKTMTSMRKQMCCCCQQFRPPEQSEEYVYVPKRQDKRELIHYI